MNMIKLAIITVVVLASFLTIKFLQADDNWCPTPQEIAEQGLLEYDSTYVGQVPKALVSGFLYVLLMNKWQELEAAGITITYEDVAFEMFTSSHPDYLMAILFTGGCKKDFGVVIHSEQYAAMVKGTEA